MIEDHDFDVLDIHQHMGSTGDAHGFVTEGQVSGADVNSTEVAARLEFMAQAKIRQAVAIPGHNYNRAAGARATHAENEAIARYRAALPGQFPVAVGIVEPLDQQAAVEELDRIVELGLKGVSFHTEFGGVTIDSPWMMKILERMGELDLVPLIHASNVVLHEALWRLGKVARALPDLQIVALEPFYTFDGLQECFFIADVAPNVIFDTASCSVNELMIEFARQFGAERVAYGSQYYSQLRRPGQLRLTRATLVLRDIIATERLSAADKQLILGGNARRVFGL